MRRIFTWGRIGAVSAAAIVLVLLLLYLLVVRSSDSPYSPTLSSNEATRIGAKYVASRHAGGGGCSYADFDASRAAWVVNCNYYDTARCENDGYSISCGPDAAIGESVLVDDQSAQVLEPR